MEDSATCPVSRRESRRRVALVKHFCALTLAGRVYDSFLRPCKFTGVKRQPWNINTMQMLGRSLFLYVFIGGSALPFCSIFYAAVLPSSRFCETNSSKYKHALLYPILFFAVHVYTYLVSFSLLFPLFDVAFSIRRSTFCKISVVFFCWRQRWMGKRVIYAIQPRRTTRTRPSAYLFNPLRSRKDRLTFEGKFVRVSKTVSSVRWNVLFPLLRLY